ncbi:MAG: 4Fe-4S dicluster domain-containing protein [Desulforhopalus sp.]|nr:4Fe-4S dicluster domain-containing protein [Desulforhopalus sp.]
MDTKRRTFLKAAGVAALAGISAPAVSKLAEASASAVPAVAENSGGTAGKMRYGMVIDMRKLYDRPDIQEKMAAACRYVHNIPTFDDPKSEIKWIWSAPYEQAFPEQSSTHNADVIEESQFILLCNHCDNPPCVRVCPTQATFKMEHNGIVAMDYHRCIGCRFCMMACPYGARSFNWFEPRPHIAQEINPEFPTRMRGVVEKCNFCAERLARGEKPACQVAAAEVGAIYFGDLNDPESEVRKVLAENPTIQRKPNLGTKPSVFYIV